LEKWGCIQLSQFIPTLSHRSCTALAQIAGFLFFWLDFKTRHIALENLRVVFGHRLPPRQRTHIALLSFQNFARTMLGLFWSAGISDAAIHQWVVPVGFDTAIAEAEKKQCGLVFACAHFGNWEFGPMATQIHGLPVLIVAETFKNPFLEEIFARLRSRSFHRLIRQEQSFLKLLRGALRGQSSALLADLTVPPSQAAVRLRAFVRDGQPLEICGTRLHAVVAMRSKALIVPALAYPTPGGKSEIRAFAPLDPAHFESEEHIAQAVWDTIERAILEAPHLWLWTYKHFRYKPADARREYPDYAISHPSFDAVARA
jgi:KDO2-lipid IV(A) lauroyltransferase